MLIQSSLSYRARRIARSQKRTEWALLTTGLSCCLLILWAVNPADSSIYPPSPFRLLTGGLFCPGCGTLRALHQLLHGHLLAAIDLNLLMVLSLPLIAYSYLVYSSHALFKPQQWFPPIYTPAKWIWVILGVILTYWILRNIPVEPFSWLAP